MVRLKYFILILLVSSFIRCTSTNKTTHDSKETYNISNYVCLQVHTQSDTIFFGDTLTITVSFINKTDSFYYFHPDALLSLERKLDYFGSEVYFEFLSEYSDADNIVLLNPHGIYSRIYHLKVKKYVFIKGENKMFVKYFLRPQNKYRSDYPILYGWLLSHYFYIYVKEK